MLHHEAMNDTERDVLHQLLEMLNSHPMVECKRMSSIKLQEENTQFVPSV
jgi:hypothetical protein